MSFSIRPAHEADFDTITAIYAEAVAHGAASFELSVPDRTEMLVRFRALSGQGYPYLVLEDKDEVQGYAYAGPYRTRPAYRFSVENSIYLGESARGKGYGKALLVELIHACEALGFRQMIAVTGDSANHASVGLHKACGFELVGTLKNVGWKHEKWLDTVFLQLSLGVGDKEVADRDSLPGKMATVTKTP